MPQVPDLIGMTPADATTALANANLVVGATTEATSATTAKGNVSGVKPAAGTLVDAGSTVDLEVSTGPIAGAPPNMVTVPSVNGLTQRAAESMLITTGLTLGQTKTTGSHAVPVGGVISSTPPGGSVVPAQTSINLQISSGMAFDWAANLPALIFTGIGFVTLVGMGIALYTSNFLVRIGDVDIARGLITFLIAVTTVITLLILVLSNIIITEPANDADLRFRRGNQLFTALIGILGTIIGYYFGSSHNPGTPTVTPTVSIATSSLPPASLSADYSTELSASGGLAPLKWSSSTLPAGLQLDDTGLLHGKLSTAPSGPFTVTVTDSGTPPHTATQALTLTAK